ncbi:serine hydrolase domain-containing protein [Paenibacillus ginsengarvi]|uniref:Class A beta-lactamase-related serine hydrolase n=1 Tax=Paenibacillus ginsengarvi TaxID=400777 RepID=A0A3B0CLM8_9BACL|nr:serine hydrolase domain-containing protein [Paenibacillus ginsengarvi]RKN86293.1 class A beta-lactamase-related serine hydrolase [Paenibacillus ginsengarvi]
MNYSMLREGTPEQAGMRPERINVLQNRVKEWVEEGATPAAAMLVARKGVIVTHNGYGPLTPDVGAPLLEKDSLFPLASLTKPLTATCIMILVEDGKLDLFDPVNRFIPEFTGDGKAAINLHHLLTHTSGLRQEDVYEFVKKQEQKGVLVPELEPTSHPNEHTFFYLSYGAPLWKPPGTEMRYLGYGYKLLGEIVRRVSGQPLHQFAAERIFAPLGMKDTFYIVPEALFGRAVRRDESLAGGRWLGSPEALRDPSASGGAYSTVMDMAIFGQMFLNGGRYGNARILSPITVREMVKNQIPGVPATSNGSVFREASWGYGWNVRSMKQDDSGCLRSAHAYDHGGAGGVRLLIEPEYDLLWAYFPIVTDKLYTRNLFHNMVVSCIDD